MKIPRSVVRHVLGGVILLVGLLPLFANAAGATLNKVRSREVLTCGVTQSLVGFAVQDQTGKWSGLTVDFCKAVAAAALGDAEKVKIIPFTAAGRFPALLSGQIDLLAHTSTVTFSREAAIGVVFAGVYLLDGGSFLVPGNSGIKSVEQLDGAKICLEKSTSAHSVVADAFNSRRLKFETLVLDGLPEMISALRSGQCQTLASDRSNLEAIRHALNQSGYQSDILPGYFSKEPLGPVVRRGDEEWATLVRWVLFALIEAEERGVTQANVKELNATNVSVAQRALLFDSGRLGAGLGLSADWVRRVIAAVGNYGEIYERNLGMASPLKIDRTYNRLWKDGGLLYSPPFR